MSDNTSYIPHSLIVFISAGITATKHTRNLPIILIQTKEGLYRTRVHHFTTDANGIHGRFKLVLP
jgi:hypothetical protein